MTLKEINSTIIIINKLIEIEEEIGEHDILPAKTMLTRLIKYGDDANIAKAIKKNADWRYYQLYNLK